MLDCFVSLAEVAVENNYTCPIVDDGDVIEIKDGRHPVVEKILPPGEKFVPNSVYLDNSENQILIITGPNMSDKSVFLRQVGLIVLLAQIGSFVPASYARVGIVDRIFTRVGASDNIAGGESTFLVEMHEMANILNNATPKSLILLDEVGRGTSTFDGISIAWAITEYIHENPKLRAKTIFATHYHELNELAELYPRIKNFKADVREVGDKVIFLHKIVPGYADHSYGIEVAKMAGLPKEVTERAKEILANLEQKELTPQGKVKKKISKEALMQKFQISLFELNDDRLRQEILNLYIDNMTPLQALLKLQELRGRIKNGDL
ncbi:MutS domain V [Candidatus Kryptobacter tengchongensis]|nr:MutS domain V [Candidatus Kryptobacter tengchongensis]